MHSEAPLSGQRPAVLQGLAHPTRPDALDAVRNYEDAAVLERAWSRLGSSRRAARGMSPVVRGLALAAVVAASVQLGMYIERLRQPQAVASVDSEVLLPAAVTPSLPTDRKKIDKRSARAKDSTGSTKKSQRMVRPSSQTPRSLSRDAATLDEPTMSEVAAPQVAAPQLKARWLVLAERGDFAGAFQALDQEGGFDAVVLTAGPEELMSLVDVARSVGRQGRAIQALRIVVDQYRYDENAPIAAMMLGNLLSKSGDAAGAAEAFALNRSLSPGGDFAEDALVREFDMAVAALDKSEAERLRAQYEQDYPGGRHHEQLSSELERLAAKLADASSAADAGATGAEAAGAEDTDSAVEQDGAEPDATAPGGAEGSQPEQSEAGRAPDDAAGAVDPAAGEDSAGSAR